MEGKMTSAEETAQQNPLCPPSEFLASCPQFRILVLGNPESTKQEIFSKVFGVDLEKVCPRQHHHLLDSPPTLPDAIHIHSPHNNNHPPSILGVPD